MKTLPLLEQDKEKLLSRLSVCDTRDAAVSAMDDELKRILYQAIETSGDEALTTDVQYALATARAALPLINVNGEIRVYERTADAGAISSKRQFPLLLAAGTARTAGGTAAFAFLPGRKGRSKHGYPKPVFRLPPSPFLPCRYAAYSSVGVPCSFARELLYASRNGRAQTGKRHLP